MPGLSRPSSGDIGSISSLPPCPIRLAQVLALYDQTVESLQHALEACGLVADRAWLPWEATTPSTGPAEGQSARKHGQEPGLLLFRPQPGRRRIDSWPCCWSVKRRRRGSRRRVSRNCIELIRSCPKSVRWKAEVPTDARWGIRRSVW